ncbi:flagellar basal body rod protein FlgC [Ornithinibacillus sp. 4-3]|uniref:Flagellar basal-body rod protein FlgC n=1 Tax=Ornithinibacillus sp. 4-3 TaxID=3231488 RepID=A0AB39HPL4_9BACI
MSIFNGLNTSASALTAQRFRMDVVSANLANAQTTRATVNDAGEFEPYRRKMVVLQSDNQNFKSILQKATTAKNDTLSGVRVSRVVEDETPFKLEFNPTHPDADEAGYVRLPNVDPLKEMVDLMGATRSYEANVTSLNATKNMLMKALEIGK